LVGTAVGVGSLSSALQFEQNPSVAVATSPHDEHSWAGEEAQDVKRNPWLGQKL
jgi:hypothetical protein